jgi:hypothetical protein
MTTIERPTELPADIVDWLSGQGRWTEEQYLWLSENTNRLVEFTDGYLEEVPTPTQKHQDILEFLFLVFLEGEAYIEHGVFPRGTAASSALLPAFTVNVDETLDAE